MNLETLHELHVKDVKNDLHPSVFFKDENYDLFILRLPLMIDGSLTAISQPYVITNQTYYKYDKSTKEFLDLKDTYGFYKSVGTSIDETLKIVYDYVQNIEEIEDQFYEGKFSKDFNKLWIKYKNELIKINRILFRTLETFEHVIKEYKSSSDYLEKNFEDMKEHLNRAYRNSGTILERLDALHNSYIVQNNEQMNRTVYILTLLSGIFLPLNLIVGFFGMNTTSLPFTIVDGGTFKVINILFVSAIVSVLLVFFIKKR